MTCNFLSDLGWLNNVNINLTSVKKSAADLLASRDVKGEHRAAWLLKSLTLIDLTTLGGDDTHSNVSRLCYKVKRGSNNVIHILIICLRLAIH